MKAISEIYPMKIKELKVQFLFDVEALGQYFEKVPYTYLTRIFEAHTLGCIEDLFRYRDEFKKFRVKTQEDLWDEYFAFEDM